jgi:hypothetical protein
MDNEIKPAKVEFVKIDWKSSKKLSYRRFHYQINREGPCSNLAIVDKIWGKSARLYIGRQAGTTTLCRSQLYPPGQGP